MLKRVYSFSSLQQHFFFGGLAWSVSASVLAAYAAMVGEGGLIAAAGAGDAVVTALVKVNIATSNPRKVIFLVIKR
jgi:hypothetical protein